MSLKAIIRDKILAQGPISIADYMELALTHPEHGYYTKQDPFGARGDFITAPEISQIFGEMIGLWCADIWSQMGRPDFALVELGPGRGTMMNDVLRATRKVDRFHERVSVQMIEVSPVLQAIQYHTLSSQHPRVSWHETLEHLPPLPTIVLANEFFDALPIKQFVKTETGLKERLVAYDEAGDHFRYVLREGGLSLAKGGGGMTDGGIMESSPAAKQVMSQLAGHLKQHHGAALVIDYGYEGEGATDSLQAVKQHSFGSVLDEPGSADITAHVNFSALMEIAKDKGLCAHGLVAQNAFLIRLGAEIRLEKLLAGATQEQQEKLISGFKRLTGVSEMGELFKVMAITSDPQLLPAGFDA